MNQTGKYVYVCVYKKHINTYMITNLPITYLYMYIQGELTERKRESVCVCVR